MVQLNDDCFAFDGDPMPVDRALALLADRLRPVTGCERVPLVEAHDRILAADVTAPFDVPPHDNAAVDGFAVRHEDLAEERETILPVAGRVAAGHPLDRAPGRGAAMRIFTGAPMPPGFDTVFMQEDCRVESLTGGDRVILPSGLKPGANRRLAGEDVTRGSVVLAAGRRLRPEDVGLLASLGLREVEVRRPLRVAVFSTGDEVREPGAPLEPGCVYDANRFLLAASLRKLGCAVTDLGILPDRFEAVRDALAAAAAAQDVLLTSGGMSIGEEDHVKAAVEANGRLDFWRLAIKPGRPVALGRVGGAAFVGLPGNPVAVMVTFLRVARPILLRLMGAAEAEPVLFPVRAGFTAKKKPGRQEYLRATLTRAPDGVLTAVKHPRDGSAVLSSLVESDGLIEIPEATTRIEPGMTVAYLPFSEVR